MPEGPEIRRQALRLHGVLAGRVAEHVYFSFSELSGAAADLTGRLVESVSAKGKAMLTTFEGGVVVYTHNQLYGRWYVRKADGEVRTRRQLRFEVRTAEHRALLYSASTIEVMLEGELDHHPFISRLGPDPIDRDADALEAHWQSGGFAGRALSGLLLDQAFAAGLGNYLRSEILFHARIDPRRKLGDLAPSERRRLARSTVTIVRRSLETGGATNAPSDVKRLKAAGHPRRVWRHYVFGQRSASCPRCGGSVRKDELAGRRLYWCPECQS